MRAYVGIHEYASVYILANSRKVFGEPKKKMYTSVYKCILEYACAGARKRGENCQKGV